MCPDPREKTCYPPGNLYHAVIEKRDGSLRQYKHTNENDFPSEGVTLNPITLNEKRLQTVLKLTFKDLSLAKLCSANKMRTMVKSPTRQRYSASSKFPISCYIKPMINSLINAWDKS